MSSKLLTFFILVLFFVLTNYSYAIAGGFDPKAAVYIEYAWKSVLGAGGFYTLIKVVTSTRHADGTISTPNNDDDDEK